MSSGIRKLTTGSAQKYNFLQYSAQFVGVSQRFFENMSLQSASPAVWVMLCLLQSSGKKARIRLLKSNVFIFSSHLLTLNTFCCSYQVFRSFSRLSRTKTENSVFSCCIHTMASLNSRWRSLRAEFVSTDCLLYRSSVSNLVLNCLQQKVIRGGNSFAKQ